MTAPRPVRTPHARTHELNPRVSRVCMRVRASTNLVASRWSTRDHDGRATHPTPERGRSLTRLSLGRIVDGHCHNFVTERAKRTFEAQLSRGRPGPIRTGYPPSIDLLGEIDRDLHEDARRKPME